MKAERISIYFINSYNILEKGFTAYSVSGNQTEIHFKNCT